jgi:hypothetical protein
VSVKAYQPSAFVLARELDDPIADVPPSDDVALMFNDDARRGLADGPIGS